MKKTLFSFLFLFVITISFAQDIQKGYYITNSGKRVDGYFKKTDFSNQNLLKFSTSEGGDFSKPDVNAVKEYGIADEYKFVKYDVKLDNADLKKVSDNKEPNFQDETIFLNVLVEGSATLYSYESTLGTKYFYKIENKNLNPEQLIYRKYNLTNSVVAENNHFRQQLYQELNCGSNHEMEGYLNLKYNKSNIVPLFEKYNKCVGSEYKVYSNKGGNTAKLNYTVYAGVNRSTFGIDGWVTSLDEESKFSYVVGAEAALTLASEKFSFYLRADYEKLSSEVKGVRKPSVFSSSYENHVFNADISLFNFSIGPRYNLILNTDNKLFIDAGLGFTLTSGDISLYTETVSSTGTTPTAEGNLSLQNPVFFNLGVGYMYKNKYGADLRINTNRNLLNEGITNNPEMKFTTIALTLRYTLN